MDGEADDNTSNALTRCDESATVSAGRAIPLAGTSRSETAALEALVNPPSVCPGCHALTGLPWPEGTTSVYCGRCLALMRRVWRCKRWNADPTHQAAAGQASYAAFSARWRAEQGVAPLTSEAARRYVTPEHIRGPLGMSLPEHIRTAVYRAWCDGLLIDVVAWLSDDPPPDPDGLWAASISPSTPTA